jgi:hypothetical protein
MQPNITANKWIKSLLYICVITYLFFIASIVHLRGYDDDQVFLSIFKSGNIIDLLVNRFDTWSGRFAIELVMTTTIGYTLFWKIGVPLSIIVVCHSCCKISGLKCSIIPFAFALVLFASMPYDINIDSSWWITGFYNYLLPVAAALYAFSVAFCGNGKTFKKVICIILAFYFPYMEQAGLAFIVAMASILFARRESIRPFNIIMTIIVLANLIICLHAPGNETRFSLETWRWYPQYQTYGIINKLSLGFDKLHQLMTFRYNIPLIALTASLFYLRSTSATMNKSVKVAMFFLATFLAISIANSFTGFFSNGFFFNSTTIDATRWSAAKLFISYLYLFIVISSMFTIMLDCIIKKEISATPLTAMLIGFMSVTMLGLSPTVYASGYRVDFIFEIVCIVSCLYIIRKASTNI